MTWKKVWNKLIKTKKEEIQKIFTKIRLELNNREDELLIEIDQMFEKEFNVESVNNIFKEKKYAEK